MTRDAYLNTLRRGLRGLPSEMQQEFLEEVSQHFSDGLAEGRNEAEIAIGLGDPEKLAAEYRTTVRLDSFRRRSSLGNFFRLLRAIFGLAGLNMALGAPAAVLTLLCMALHTVAISVYLTGILLVSSGVSGVDRIAIRTATAPTIEVQQPMEGQDMPQRGLELEIVHTGLRVVESTADLRRPAPDLAERCLSALLGILYVLIAIPIWNLCIRLDRRAILWLASYARTNLRIARSARTADAVQL